MAKFIIDMEEAIVAVRKQYGLPESVKIEIKYDEDSYKSVDESEWIDVPFDWDDSVPPKEAQGYDMIEVMFRNQRTAIAHSRSWANSWIQENDPADIVKYRKAP